MKHCMSSMLKSKILQYLYHLPGINYKSNDNNNIQMSLSSGSSDTPATSLIPPTSTSTSNDLVVKIISATFSSSTSNLPTRKDIDDDDENDTKVSANKNEKSDEPIEHLSDEELKDSKQNDETISSSPSTPCTETSPCLSTTAAAAIKPLCVAIEEPVLDTTTNEIENNKKIDSSSNISSSYVPKQVFLSADEIEELADEIWINKQQMSSSMMGGWDDNNTSHNKHSTTRKLTNKSKILTSSSQNPDYKVAIEYFRRNGYLHWDDEDSSSGDDESDRNAVDEIQFSKELKRKNQEYQKNASPDERKLLQTLDSMVCSQSSTIFCFILSRHLTRDYLLKSSFVFCRP
jgi:hypothetical protein